MQWISQLSRTLWEVLNACDLRDRVLIGSILKVCCARGFLEALDLPGIQASKQRRIFVDFSNKLQACLDSAYMLNFSFSRDSFGILDDLYPSRESFRVCVF